MGKNQDPGSGINISDPPYWFDQKIKNFSSSLDPDSSKALVSISDPDSLIPDPNPAF
jgi:hypothetical protein